MIGSLCLKCPAEHNGTDDSLYAFTIQGEAHRLPRFHRHGFRCAMVLGGELATFFLMAFSLYAVN